ncbi:hypothetical protein [Acidicapsa ligni]|uniref:hypothetical protein n=1 Tax=Acidicapsa ligni TaxID=542300 RepID=UPI0021DFE8E9|nr:hypothetical protein [Acidicapsa ligni]
MSTLPQQTISRYAKAHALHSSGYRNRYRNIGLLLAICFGWRFAALSQNTPAPALSTAETQALVQRVLHTELEAAQDTSHPMQYQLRKASPRFTSTKLLVETKDGDVARLIAVNDQPLSAEAQQSEAVRLQGLLADPGLQRHRREREQGDTERARKVMQALPDAFVYQYAGIVDTPQGPSYRMTFQPNPNFDPQDLEAQVLKAMAGELWIDVAQQRVTRLEGKRIHDVAYGWGLLGKLDQGGTLLLEQGDVGNHQWRTLHMVLVMNARVLLKSIKLDTTLELSQFQPVANGISYQQAIEILNSQQAKPSKAGK